jgi:hypothetical protein
MAISVIFEPFADTLAGKLYHEFLRILLRQISTTAPQCPA